MTDDEINRRVAELEGWAMDSLFGGMWRNAKTKDAWVDSAPPPYTTDWGWCGPLIEKHKISILPFCEKWGANPLAYGEGTQYADTPQRAICLAVIASHEGKPSGVWTGLGDK